MKYAFAVGSLYAALAVAGPLNKRATETVWVFETATVTVTGGQQAPTTSAAAGSSPGAFYSVPAAPAVVPTSAVAEAAPSAVAQTGLSDYAQPILDAHNQKRALHGSPALVWDDDLASIAEQVGNLCSWDHNTKVGGGGYGQNYGAGVNPSDVANFVKEAFYDKEEPLYHYYGTNPPDNPSDFGDWGHFTQLVWKNTQSVGCATVSCPGLAGYSGSTTEFTVCNYKPAGNVVGGYDVNVLAPN